MDLQRSDTSAKLSRRGERSRARGLSLMEILISLGVFALALGLVVSLFSRYSQAVRFQEGRSRLTAVSNAGQVIRREVREAFQVSVNPDRASLVKIDPGRSLERLDLSRDPSDSVDLFGTAFQLEVEYSLENGRLMRRSKRFGDLERVSTLAVDLDHLSFAEDGPLLRCTLGFQSGTRTVRREFLLERR